MIKIKNPTLVIGLGGTGFHCISKMKSFIEEEVGETPSSIKFLAIDFDKPENNKSRYNEIFTGEDSKLNATSDYSENWIRISGTRDSDYERAIRQPAAETDLAFFESDPVKKNELLNTIGSFDLSVGAGQKRILGKIGISYSTNYTRVKDKIKEAIRPLETVNVEGNEAWDSISVLIVNSFSGGAGAGIFLDILFMLNEVSSNGKGLEILTFNFLPDVFLNGLSNNIFPNLVEPNAFATITELEYIYNNVQDFRPTNSREPLGSSKTLPKANFLINQTSYNGSKLSLKSMLYSTARTMFNLVISGNGLDTQWSNFQAQMSGNVKGKTRIFCSLGYSEIVFDSESLKRFTHSRILNQSWNSYNKVNLKSSTDSGILRSDEETFIPNLKENYVENLLIKSSNKTFTERVEGQAFPMPSGSKEGFPTIKSSILSNKDRYEEELRKAVRDYYTDSLLIESIRKEKEKISVSSFNKTILAEKKDAYKNRLLSFKENLDRNETYLDRKSNFDERFQLALAEINSVPRKYQNLFKKIKTEFYSTVLANRTRNIRRLLEADFSKLIVQDETIRLFNNSIENGLIILANEDTNNVDKLNWITTNKKETHLKQNEDNIIFLESYFQRHIEEKIANDPEISSNLIEQYLTDDSGFEKAIAHIDTIQYLNELCNKNLYELKAMLSQAEVNQIVGKVGELLNPLWDRASDHEINQGKTSTSGKLIKFSRVETPILDDGTVGDFFGKNEFSVHEGDIFPSGKKHRQSFINLELGLPAYLVKSMKRYKNTFDDEIALDENTSVNYFAYNEIRVKTLNGEEGIFVFKDDAERSKQGRGLSAWAFGWSQGIFFKENQRIKIKVTEHFTPVAENSANLENGVYDAFKELGQSADLLRIFNEFKSDDKLIDDIEKQIHALKKASSREFLRRVAETFEATSDSDRKQRFRTEKKAYSQLSDEERKLLNVKEQEALKVGAEEIANANAVRIDFNYENSGNEQYLRLTVK
jgi:hypothetical protein